MSAGTFTEQTLLVAAQRGHFLTQCRYLQISICKGQKIAVPDSIVLVLDTVIIRSLKLDSIGQIAPVQLDDDHFIDVLARGKGVFKIHDQNYPLVVRGMVGPRLRIERNGQLMTGFDKDGYLADDLNVKNLAAVRLLHGARSVVYGSGGIGGVLIVEEGAVLFKKSRSAYMSYSSSRPCGLQKR